MKVSYAWLQTLLPNLLPPTELSQVFSMAGLEVDAQYPVAASLEHVVVGRVVACAPHPNADRLKVCEVDVGSERLTIVCGAKNVASEQRVPVAKVGGHVGALKIKKAKLRGVESFGMICSSSELGLSDQSSGIMVLSDDAPIGMSIVDYLALDDHTIEFDLTPNRGDCLSHVGVAREAAALQNIAYQVTQPKPQPITDATEIAVTVAEPSACGRYLGRVIHGINNQTTSPLWLQERLRRCGLRPIDPVVDVTNYVMLELGQPMHAYDADKLSQGLTVRYAHAGEVLTLLDEQTVELTPDCFVIADAKGCLALAGVMGGKASSVTPQTSTIFLESAHFNPVVIAGRARRYGLHTQSAARFERGVDPTLPHHAIERATELLLRIVGGQAGPVTQQETLDALPRRRDIRLRLERIERVLGVAFEANVVKSHLMRLGFNVDSIDDGFNVTVPAHRFDIMLEVDLIEEVARMHGYDTLPAQLPSLPLTLYSEPEAHVKLSQLQQVLIGNGFREVITYSFVDPNLQQCLFPERTALTLKNPISPALAQMRSSLWPGLLKTLQYNQNRQITRLRIFESGLCFIQNPDLQQTKMLAGLMAGDQLPPQWGVSPIATDFYDMKQCIEQLLAPGKMAYEFVPSALGVLHPGQRADIWVNGKQRGYCGQLHPGVAKQLDIHGPVFMFELELSALTEGTLHQAQPISKYPMIKRDLAIVCEETVPAKTVYEMIRQAAGALLVDVNIFDVYRGKGIEKGQKSIALGIILQDVTQTLTDDKVSATIRNIIDALQKNVKASLRD